MATKLAFRTKVGGVSIPVGHSQELGSVDVSEFERIRLVADERAGSAGNVSLRLTITEGSELVAQLDTVNLTPHAQTTRVYEVPGNKLSIFADVAGTGAGETALDVLVYGSTG
jgi:hypothetical protein